MHYSMLMSCKKLEQDIHSEAKIVFGRVVVVVLVVRDIVSCVVDISPRPVAMF